MPAAPEQTHVSNKHFYDRISHAYDAIADDNEHAAREIGEKMLDVQTGERVLEIGFGTGNSLLHFARMVGDAGKACGVDVSSGMLAVAEQKIEEAGLGEIVELKIGDAVAVPWSDGEFDAAFLSFTLELFSEQDVPRVLSEVRRVLRPGGRLAVVSMATVADDERESVLEKSYKWMHRHFPHIVDCRPIDVVSLLAESGFTIQQEQRLSIWTMPVTAVLAKSSN